MCFKNLPIEFDDAGVATLRGGIPDPYSVTVTKPDAGLTNDEQRERIDATRRPSSGKAPFTDAEWKAVRNVCK